MNNILLLPRYGSQGASSRVLYLLHLPYLHERDAEVSVLPRFSDTYPRALVRRLLGCKINAELRHAAVVLAGNEYLSKRIREADASPIEVIATVVDKKGCQPYPQEVAETSGVHLGKLRLSDFFILSGAGFYTDSSILPAGRHGLL